MRAISIFCVLVLSCSVGWSQEIRVDIDRHPGHLEPNPSIGTDPETQSGFASLQVSDSSNPNVFFGDGQLTLSSALGVSGTVTVNVNGAASRNRADVPGEPLSDLLEDFTFQDGLIQVFLQDMKAGIYQITSYHADFNDATGELLTGSDTNFDIEVIDALGTREAVSNAQWSTSGETYLVESDGLGDITLNIRGDNPIAAAPGQTRLNGLVIARIPEPSTLHFVGLAVCCWCGCRWRRCAPL